MKRILLALTALVLLLPATPRVEARTDISVDFFYDNLGSGGNWVEVGDYGYCWQPTVSVSNRSWRPYSDGYWAYTDVGWTWISYEDFGWATYHYGRWTRVRDRGWFWVPGREWGPAWVSWRHGGDYIGWAPLPPRGGGEVVYDSRPINAQVDIDFDIGPDYYNFVDVRYIGEPVLRERIFAPDRNVTYISSTVNVTNITYSNNQVYNYGPDYNTVSRYSTRPIQRLTLQRDANVDVSAAARSNALMKVQGDKLVIAAPPVFTKPPTPVAPKVVKEKITAPTFEHGWTGDAKAQAELKQKIKAEDPKTVAPPTVKPRDGADVTQSPATSPAAATATATPASAPTAAASASPKASAIPAASASAATSPSAAASPSPAKDKGKDKGRDNVSPAPNASAPASPAMTPDKSKNKREEKATPVTTPAQSLAPSVSSTPPPPPNKPEKPKRNEKAPVTPPSDASSASEKSTAPSAAPPVRPNKREVLRPTPPEPVKPETDLPNANKPPKNNAPLEPKPQTLVEPESKSKKQPLTQERPAPPTRDIQPDNAPKRPLPPERVAPPPGPAANAPVNPPEKSHGKDEGKKKNEPATSPTP